MEQNETHTGTVETLNDALAAVVRREQGERKWSLPTLAVKSTIPRGTLRRLVDGNRQWTTETIPLIAKAFGMKASELMAAAEDRLRGVPVQVNRGPVPAQRDTQAEIDAALAGGFGAQLDKLANGRSPGSDDSRGVNDG